ncbi:glycosyl hydrolase family 18 [Alistipes sp.]|uniref:glycosyl hydrolase family 18 n=1 Tax=Alistipes sp. TaxID=1872444 RepID=UPI003AF0EE22
MKKIYLWLLLAALVGLTGCEKAEFSQSGVRAAVPQTRATSLGDFYRMATVEANNVDPRNAGEYLLSDSTRFFTHIALWGATIGGDRLNRVYLSFTKELKQVLDNPQQYIEPLQAKGIKVLLWVEGDQSGAGFSNLTAAQIETFTDALTAYDSRVDGYFLNDEWAAYGINNWPAANSTSYSNLVVALRRKTDKMLCVYDRGYSCYFSNEIASYIERCCCPQLNGYCTTPGFEIPLTRYCPYMIDLDMPPSERVVKARTTMSVNRDAGGIFFEKVPGAPNRLSTFNAVASAFGMTCTHTGVIYPKDYPVN